MLHDALRLMRVYHNLTQKQLAESLGISKSHLSEIESGKKNPTLEMLEKYSQVFKMPVSSIMFFSENLEQNTPSSKVKRMVSAKVLKLLDYIAECSPGKTEENVS
jgi:transcriptional regulator with XRE-family HTH domain